MFNIEKYVKSSQRVSSLISKLKEDPAIKLLKEEISTIKPNKVNMSDRVISSIAAIDILLAIKQMDETPLEKYDLTLEDVKTKIIRSITTAYIKEILNAIEVLNNKDKNQFLLELNEENQKNFSTLMNYYYATFSDFVLEKEPGFLPKDINSNITQSNKSSSYQITETITNNTKDKPASIEKTKDIPKVKLYENNELLDILIEFEDRLSLVFIFNEIETASNDNYEDEDDKVRKISRAISCLEIFCAILNISDNKKIRFETHSIDDMQKIFKNSISEDAIISIIESSEKLAQYIQDDMNKYPESLVDYKLIIEQLEDLNKKLNEYIKK